MRYARVKDHSFFAGPPDSLLPDAILRSSIGSVVVEALSGFLA